MEQPALTVAIISKKIRLGNNNIILIPMFAVRGSYNKYSKTFIADDGTKYINARSKRGIQTNDDLVCDYFANMDTDTSLKAFGGDTEDERIENFFSKSRGTIANIMIDSENNIASEELLNISLFDGEDIPEFVDGEPVTKVRSTKSKQSVRAELDSIISRILDLNERFQNSVLNKKYSIEDVKRIIDSADGVVDEAEALKDNAILFRDAYQTGEDGILLKGDSDEERKKRQIEYAAALENTTPDVIEKIPDYFDPKRVHETVCKSLIGQDEPARRVIREIHRKTIDPSERNLGILITGHTGCGKTFLMKLLEKVLNRPVILVDTTQITVPGFTGRDIEEVLYSAYKIYGDAVEEAIVFFDEIDKKGSKKHSDVGGRGVLDVLLAFLDGTTYQARDSSSLPKNIVPINTAKMIKIAGGAFSDIDQIKKSQIGFNNGSIEATSKAITPTEFIKEGEMSDEFMGRFPTHVKFNVLNLPRIEDIIRRSDDSMLKKQVAVFERLGVKLVPTDGFIHRVAENAVKKGGGARGLNGTILEATGPAYDDINWNLGEIEEIELTEETADNPYSYQKVYRKKA